MAGSDDRSPAAGGAEEPEVLLRGGFTNAGKVVRKGETVRRPMRPTSPATHALLLHLERVGFDGAPRFLRVDKRGREVHSYIHGHAATTPLPPWSLTDEALVSVAQLLRRFHDAQAGFDLTQHTWSLSAPQQFGHTLISHNDPCPDNIVFREGRAVALIDFDLASPGSRRWDVACAARLWSPLRDPVDVAGGVVSHSLQRFRLFLDAYGLASRDRDDFAEMVEVAYQWTYDLVRAQVAQGHTSFVPYWNGGGAARADRGLSWVAAHRADIDAAAVGDQGLS